jgi:hypothetical protein
LIPDSSDIGANLVGASGDNNVIHIGIQGTQDSTLIAGIYGETAAGGSAVYITSSGTLGTMPSSARFKRDIHDMDNDSSAILALRPVSFKYKSEIDPAGIPQYGLVAEEVDKVAPALVIHDTDGKAYSVRYEAVNAMLLNEFRKEHQVIGNQNKTIASQQTEIEALNARLEALEKKFAAR